MYLFCVCVCVCVRACVRAWVRAYVRACAHVHFAHIHVLTSVDVYIMC